MLLVPVDDPLPSATPLATIFGEGCERILSRTYHDTSDSLKATMVAEFADNEAFMKSKVLLGSC